MFFFNATIILRRRCLPVCHVFSPPLLLFDLYLKDNRYRFSVISMDRLEGFLIFFDKCCLGPSIEYLGD